METLKEVLMRRDDMSAEDAGKLIGEARSYLLQLLSDGEYVDADYVCQDWFGLEPDYLCELLPY